MSTKYFDCSATTKPSAKTMEIIAHYGQDFYNPSAVYKEANIIKEDINKAREKLADFFNAHNGGKFVFTPSATISNSCVLRTQITRKDKKYLISAGEHSSVYFTAKAMKEEGYNIVFVPLLKSGHIDKEALYSELDNSVAFVSIIHTSNETGAINDIGEIARYIHANYPRVVVHSDGVQSINKIHVDLQDLDVDFYTISGHKINCMRGISALYIRYFAKQKPYIYGGGQEFNIVAGTENVAGIVSLASAVKEPNLDYSLQIRHAILEKLSTLEDVYIYDGKDYCPNIIMLCVADVRGETIVHMMNDRGFMLGTGSACNSKDKTNRVLSETKLAQRYALGAIRISFDEDTKQEDALDMVDNLIECIKVYRSKI